MPSRIPPSPPAPAVPAVPLSSVAVGAVATLHEVRDDASRSLLQSLGLHEACVMRLCKVGDPCIIGLSSAVARCLYVVPEADADT
jgi:carbonic anhydrase/acetyltransferase-like protein (isoleucine patch superfamily)